MGPRTELEHWRDRMGVLNGIIEQLRTEQCRAVVGVLQIIKSRALKRWKVRSSRPPTTPTTPILLVPLYYPYYPYYRLYRHYPHYPYYPYQPYQPY